MHKTSVIDVEEELRLVICERDRALKELTDTIQARDEFMFIASHELKTPLTSLHLQLQMLHRKLQNAKNSETADVEAHPVLNYSNLIKTVSICEQQSKKLADLVDELLDQSRIHSRISK